MSERTWKQVVESSTDEEGQPWKAGSAMARLHHQAMVAKKAAQQGLQPATGNTPGTAHATGTTSAVETESAAADAQEAGAGVGASREELRARKRSRSEKSESKEPEMKTCTHCNARVHAKNFTRHLGRCQKVSKVDVLFAKLRDAKKEQQSMQILDEIGKLAERERSEMPGFPEADSTEDESDTESATGRPRDGKTADVHDGADSSLGMGAGAGAGAGAATPDFDEGTAADDEFQLDALIRATSGDDSSASYKEDAEQHSSDDDAPPAARRRIECDDASGAGSHGAVGLEDDHHPFSARGKVTASSQQCAKLNALLDKKWEECKVILRPFYKASDPKRAPRSSLSMPVMASDEPLLVDFAAYNASVLGGGSAPSTVKNNILWASRFLAFARSQEKYREGTDELFRRRASIALADKELLCRFVEAVVDAAKEADASASDPSKNMSYANFNKLRDGLKRFIEWRLEHLDEVTNDLAKQEWLGRKLQNMTTSLDNAKKVYTKRMRKARKTTKEKTSRTAQGLHLDFRTTLEVTETLRAVYELELQSYLTVFGASLKLSKENFRRTTAVLFSRLYTEAQTSRPSDYTHMTLAAIDKMFSERIDKESVGKVMVTNTKTVATMGHLQIQIPADLCESLLLYRRFVRPQSQACTNTPDSRLWVKHVGKDVIRADRLIKFAFKEMVNVDIRPTDMRHAFSDEIERQRRMQLISEEEGRIAHESLGHGESTALREYVMPSHAVRSRAAATAMENALYDRVRMSGDGTTSSTLGGAAQVAAAFENDGAAERLVTTPQHVRAPAHRDGRIARSSPATTSSGAMGATPQSFKFRARLGTPSQEISSQASASGLSSLAGTPRLRRTKSIPIDEIALILDAVARVQHGSKSSRIDWARVQQVYRSLTTMDLPVDAIKNAFTNNFRRKTKEQKTILMEKVMTFFEHHADEGYAPSEELMTFVEALLE